MFVKGEYSVNSNKCIEKGDLVVVRRLGPMWNEIGRVVRIPNLDDPLYTVSLLGRENRWRQYRVDEIECCLFNKDEVYDLYPAVFNILDDIGLRSFNTKEEKVEVYEKASTGISKSITSILNKLRQIFWS